MHSNLGIPLQMVVDKLLRLHSAGEVRFDAADVRAFMEHRGDCTFEMETTPDGGFIIRRRPLVKFTREEDK